MSNERCTDCEGDRKEECDTIRENIAGTLAMLMDFPNLCNGFGYSSPACVTEAAHDLEGIGCNISPFQLVQELNPEKIF